MISPGGLLDHARALAGTGKGRPPDVALRRGVSAAYYSVFHHLTDRAARHLIGSATEQDRNRIRRAWTHGELAAAADMVVDRAKAVAKAPHAPLAKEAAAAGPLVDLAASDPGLVSSLKLFSELQARRHLADYDHDARFDKASLVAACDDAAQAQHLFEQASATSREAFLSLLALRRQDLRAR